MIGSSIFSIDRPKTLESMKKAYLNSKENISPEELLLFCVIAQAVIDLDHKHKEERESAASFFLSGPNGTFAELCAVCGWDYDKTLMAIKYQRPELGD